MCDFGGHGLEGFEESGARGGVGFEGWQWVGLEADAEEDTACLWLGDEGLSLDPKPDADRVGFGGYPGKVE